MVRSLCIAAFIVGTLLPLGGTPATTAPAAVVDAYADHPDVEQVDRRVIDQVRDNTSHLAMSDEHMVLVFTSVCDGLRRGLPASRLAAAVATSEAVSRHDAAVLVDGAVQARCPGQASSVPTQA